MASDDNTSDMPDGRVVIATTVDTIAWNPAGTLLAVSFDQEVLHAHLDYLLYTQVIDMDKQCAVIFADNYHAKYLFWLPEDGGDHLLLISGFGGIRRYDVANGLLLGEVDELDPSAWFNLDGATLDAHSRLLTIILSPVEASVPEPTCQWAFIYDADSLTLLKSIRLPFQVTQKRADAISWIGSAPHGSLIATAHHDGRLRFWRDLEQPAEWTAVIAPGQPHYAGEWSPDGQAVAVGGVDRRLTVIDSAKSEIITQVENSADVRSILWHPDGRQVYASGAIWDARNGTRLEEVATGDHFSAAAAWSPSGDLYFGRYFADDAGIRSLTDSILDAGAVVIVSHRDPLGK